MASNPQLKDFYAAIDLKRPQCVRPFEVVEGDTGNRITAELTDSGTPVDLTGHYVAAIFSAPHGVSVQDSADGSVTIDGNKAVISLLPGSVSPGLVECELQIYSTAQIARDTLVTTARFSFTCRRAMFGEEAVHALPQFPYLTQTLSQIEQAEAARAAAENTRVSNEGVRQSRESQRVMAESARASAETARAANEQQRQTAEAARIANEQQRQTAEAARIANEQLRQSAEEERAVTFAGILESAGVGAKAVNSAPTQSTAESVGRILVVRGADEAYICTDGGIQGGNPYSIWRMLRLENPWTELNTITLASDQQTIQLNTDSNGASFSYDELEIELVGMMRASTVANISINGSLEYVKDSTFMNKDALDMTKSMTVIRLKKRRSGFALYEKTGSGVTDSTGSAAAKAIQAGCLKLTRDEPYSSVTITVSNSSAKFAAGTVIKLRGRNSVA